MAAIDYTIVGLLNDCPSWVIDNLVFFCKSGSSLYGLDHEDSDNDYIGVVIPPIDYWVGSYNFDSLERKAGNCDVKIYDIRKLLILSSKMNPNVLEIMFVNSEDENCYIYEEPWEYCVSCLYRFLNKNDIYDSFGGYSRSMLKKMFTKQSNQTGRRGISEKYGFDTKFAMHSFRLVFEAIDLFRDHTLEFPLKERGFLLDVRFGKAYSEMEECIYDINAQLKNLDCCFEGSTLQEKGNPDFLNTMFIHIFNNYVEGQK